MCMHECAVCACVCLCSCYFSLGLLHVRMLYGPSWSDLNKYILQCTAFYFRASRTTPRTGASSVWGALRRFWPRGTVSPSYATGKTCTIIKSTRTSAIAEGPHDASCQLKSCQLPRDSAETTCTTSPEQIEVMKLED